MYLNEEFEEDEYKDNIVKLNNLGIFDLSNKIITLRNIASGDFNAPHELQKIPSYRIVIKQIGGGYITDQDKNNTDKLMFLNNSGNIIKELILIVG